MMPWESNLTEQEIALRRPLHPQRTDETRTINETSLMNGYKFISPNPFYLFTSLPSLFSIEAILDSSLPDLPSR